MIYLPFRKQDFKKVKITLCFFCVTYMVNIESAFSEGGYGVNFTNPLAWSTNAPAHRVWRHRFHQQNFTQLYQYKQPEVMPYFYAVRSVPYTSKSSISLQKLLIKSWLNWPLISLKKAFERKTILKQKKGLSSNGISLRSRIGIVHKWRYDHFSTALVITCDGGW